MEKLKQYKYIILIILVILGLAFYWFQIRPAQIIKECYKVAQVPNRFNDIAHSNLTSLNEEFYKNCLLEKGIKK